MKFFLNEKECEVPKKEEIERCLSERHTPGVYEKAKKACVGIAGLGGLGSNIAVLLARAGVGKLIISDFDIVEISNLNRQHYFIDHIGMKKTHALEDIISHINPFIQIEKRDAHIDEKNCLEIFKDAQIIIEAFDNPKAKATLVNSILKNYPEKKLIAASGMAGYFSNNLIRTKKIKDNFYVVGDGKSEAKPGCGLMAPRVCIAASHQANMALRLILGENNE